MTGNQTSQINEGFERQAHDLINRKEFDQAETLLNSVLKREPDSADAYYFLGVSAFLQGNIGTSIEHLRHAIELDAHHTDASICLSVLYSDIGKYPEAKRAFDQANQSVVHKRVGDDSEIDRKFAIKHLELADLYFRCRRYDEAIEEYSKAAVLNPKDLEIRIRHAKAVAKKGFLSRAVQELQMLKNENPEYAPARIQLGLLHYSQGNLLDAELEWENVLHIDPVNREALSYLEMAKQNRLGSNTNQ